MSNDRTPVAMQFAETMPSGEQPWVGRTLGKYRLRKQIGAGGMGAVYEAEHVQLGRLVAVKIILQKHAQDRNTLQRFFAEARAVAALQHPNVVAVTDFGEDCPSYIVMELLKGKPLSEVIGGTGFSVERALNVSRQILNVLDVVHQKGIIHRDLKPANVFLVEDGVHVDFVKLLDFGIAKFTHDHGYELARTKTGEIVGTPQYIAPEQIEGGAIDTRADLYSFGLIAYEMLTGSPAFTANSLTSLFSKQLTEQPPYLVEIRPDIPSDVANVIHRCLEKDPADRYASASEASSALESCHSSSFHVGVAEIQHDPGQPRPSTHAPMPGGKKRSLSLLLLCLVIASCVGLGVLVGWKLLGERNPVEHGAEGPSTDERGHGIKDDPQEATPSGTMPPESDGGVETEREGNERVTKKRQESKASEAEKDSEKKPREGSSGTSILDI